MQTIRFGPRLRSKWWVANAHTHHHTSSPHSYSTFQQLNATSKRFTKTLIRPNMHSVKQSKLIFQRNRTVFRWFSCLMWSFLPSMSNNITLMLNKSNCIKGTFPIKRQRPVKTMSGLPLMKNFRSYMCLYIQRQKDRLDLRQNRGCCAVRQSLCTETITATRWQCDSAAGPLPFSYHFPFSLSCWRPSSKSAAEAA